MLENYQKTILELMIQQESLLAELYSTFGNKFTMYQDFWDSLAQEENLHAEWIKKLWQAQDDNHAVFEEGKVTTYTLKTYIEHIERIIDKAKNDEFDMKTATKTALDLEMSLIEKNYFSRFQFDNPKYEWIMDRLQNETTTHIQKVRDLISRLK